MGFPEIALVTAFAIGVVLFGLVALCVLATWLGPPKPATVSRATERSSTPAKGSSAEKG